MSGCRKIPRIRQRSEFLTVAGKGQKWVTKGLVIQALEKEYSEQTDFLSLRVGFTASKRSVGNAVCRNRAKRRLRALADQYLRDWIADGAYDLVLIARGETLERPFDVLVGDLHYALRKLKLPVKALDR